MGRILFGEGFFLFSPMMMLLASFPDRDIGPGKVCLINAIIVYIFRYFVNILGNRRCFPGSRRGNTLQMIPIVVYISKRFGVY